MAHIDRLLLTEKQRIAHPATQLGSLSSKKEGAQLVTRRQQQVTVLISLDLA